MEPNNNQTTSIQSLQDQIRQTQEQLLLEKRENEINHDIIAELEIKSRQLEEELEMARRELREAESFIEDEKTEIDARDDLLVRLQSELYKDHEAEENLRYKDAEQLKSLRLELEAERSKNLLKCCQCPDVGGADSEIRISQPPDTFPLSPGVFFI